MRPAVPAFQITTRFAAVLAIEAHCMLAVVDVQGPMAATDLAVRIHIREGFAGMDLIHGDGLGAAADVVKAQIAARAPPVGFVLQREGAG